MVNYYYIWSIDEIIWSAECFRSRGRNSPYPDTIKNTSIVKVIHMFPKLLDSPLQGCPSQHSSSFSQDSPRMMLPRSLIQRRSRRNRIGTEFLMKPEHNPQNPQPTSGQDIEGNMITEISFLPSMQRAYVCLCIFMSYLWGIAGSWHHTL